jgi:dipeptidyl aminopeptidase/acylaminoacyl peptidase
MQPKDLIKVSRIELSGIPCVYAEPGYMEGKLPTVIYYHGWSSFKEKGTFLASILACRGCRVILPDSLYHGERGSLDYYKGGVLEEHFWEVILKTLQESGRLIEDIRNLPGVDPSRIAVTGHSMGGFIASGVFAEDESIRCLVTINGSCAWEKAETIFREEGGIALASEEQFRQIREHDPIGQKGRLYPRPMLLLHGSSDTQIPLKIQEHFYSEISGIYRDNPERVKLYVVPGLDHKKTIEMIEEMAAWIDKYI